LHFVVFFCMVALSASAQRRDVLIDTGWRTVADKNDPAAYRGSEATGYNDRGWKLVDVPHNWDDYGGYRRLRHGNLHGYAWYRRSLVLEKKEGLRYFLWFEGVGSYATVWVNGRPVGGHAGGRTSFTLDITGALRAGRASNIIAVRADHPAMIRDLPWVCGGCSDERDRGFSEGSQPMGIFRPVHLVVTQPLRVEPFGVHVWNDTSVSERSAALMVETEVKNYGENGDRRGSNGSGGGDNAGTGAVWVVNRLVDAKGLAVATARIVQGIPRGEPVLVRQQLPVILRPHLWSTGHPYLYTLVTELVCRGRVIDRVTTPYGIRRIQWPDLAAGGPHPFLLNGKPVFINGIAEYEHRLGQSHAFTDAEIRARVLQIRAAGFNAFRDAHQPHNLLYQHYWDSLGLLWWPQLSAHIWFDTPAFRRNFKTLLTEWIKERRNSPSVVLWGLQNESKLPEDFARECVALIRQLDPTASSQRRITTCNGGSGTDWDVPQNWTGTYGGDPATYAEDLRRQVLVGEYGAWRSLERHGDVVNSEDRMTGLMETKIRLAESVKDQVAGQFCWLYSSHDNPGRVQSGEGSRELDRIGPVNYKGLLTEWEEPTDAYYLYRSNFVPASMGPMVYIVSHTWPDRWAAPGKKDGIIVYSNCDEVELFNDVGDVSLGRKKKGGIGTHFQWDGADIRYNVLYAIGYVGGKAVAKDYIVLHHLPQAPHFNKLISGGPVLPEPGYNYLYRVNCGGPDYTDREGHVWLADRHYTGGRTWGSTSWTDDYPGLPSFFASQRITSDLIVGTTDGGLFQDFRYGLDKLGYTFPVHDGVYRLELYFAEPWLGRGGGMDCTGWRRFDVAVNGRVVLKNLDLWKEAGYDRMLKKVIPVTVTGGKLVISFPHAVAGQALISAIAIATTDGRQRPALPSPDVIVPVTLEPAYDLRPVTSYKVANARVAGDTTEWHISVGVGDTYSLTIKYRYLPATAGAGRIEVRMEDGTLIKEGPVNFLTTPAAKWNYFNTSTGTMINAGHYKVRLIAPVSEGVRVDELQVQ
jgi:hypothetical protein